MRADDARLVRLLRLIEQSQARIDHAQTLNLMAADLLRIAVHALERQRMQKVEQNVMRALVEQQLWDEGAGER